MGWGVSLLLIFFWIIGCAAPVFALSSARLTIADLKTSAFPNQSFSLVWKDMQGNFVADLKADEVLIHEDGKTVPAAGVLLQSRGVQFSIALNAGPGMGPKPNSAVIGGKTQLDAARDVLKTWLSALKSNAQTSGADDFSLVTNTGLQVIRSRAPDAVIKGLDDYQPDFFKTQTNLFSLTTALDLAGDPKGTGGLQPAVLYVTPGLDEKESAGLANQTARAAKLGVPVFVWLVVADPAAQREPPGMAALQELADASGGRLALISGGTTFPDVEDWVKPLRQVYQVSYQSGVRTTGSHTLAAQVSRGGQTVTADADLRFDINLRPPNPMFISPPAHLDRTWTQATQKQPAALAPDSLGLQMIVEFPDKISRPLKATRLYVNGKLAAENLSAPFDHFDWSLAEVTQSGQVNLRVEVEDALGLSGASSETLLDVTVAPKADNSLLPHISSQGMIAVGAVLLAGLVLALVVAGESRLRGRQRGSARRREKDPVTQPVPIRRESPSRPRKTGAAPAWPKVEKAPPAPARMVRLTEAETPASGGPVPLNRAEITFGSDARLVVVAVDDSSVHPLHARLTRTREGNFLLSDEGSVAGTWVNYAQINGKGKLLQHGDLIHLGRAMFRFELTAPQAQRELVVSLVEDRV